MLKENNKGITLIALLVTIIVIVILASITIASVTDDSGIILHAQNAKNATETSENNINNKVNNILQYANGLGVGGTHTHSYKVIETKAATCVQEGYNKLKCTTCDKEKTETLAKDPDNHEGTVSTTYKEKSDKYHILSTSCNASGCIPEQSEEFHSYSSYKCTKCNYVCKHNIWVNIDSQSCGRCGKVLTFTADKPIHLYYELDSNNYIKIYYQIATEIGYYDMILYKASYSVNGGAWNDVSSTWSTPDYFTLSTPLEKGNTYKFELTGRSEDSSLYWYSETITVEIN